MDSRAQNNPCTVEEVFRDFKGRRAGLSKALTTDVEDFYNQCDPDKENLCLYGFPSEQWEVNLPAEEVPPELPEPVLGINFARDGMQEKDWMSLVAVHSDSWKRLFNMIIELPSIFEVVTGTAKKQVKEKSSVSNHSGSKSRSSSKVRASEPQVKQTKALEPKDEEEELVSSSSICLAEPKLLTGCQNSVTKCQQCPLSNITYCLATEVELVRGKNLVIMIYNSLGWKRNELIRTPVVVGDVKTKAPHIFTGFTAVTKPKAIGKR
ncbi:hypothetical protein KIW84_074113 [Lathyrus oleraceus]|uniref:PHD finger protein ALFIN-LIKE n=1 Tax=Pisum sativum TaxID=3888 RepID=A0A9D4ZY72_PEA|nr:hypothetical protein KIW84_074113 [Pisum sativum]